MRTIRPNSICRGDCLKLLKHVESGSVDMVLCDLPYGMTQNKWDVVIPFEPLWEEYRRVLKRGGVSVLTASQPFTSALVMSNPRSFKHEWIWIKNRGSNFANTARGPFKEHESVLVFSPNGTGWTYNKQMQARSGGGSSRAKYKIVQRNMNSITEITHTGLPELRLPSSWQKFNTEVGLHPTQKPVPLFEYLIRTYTNEGDLVLDNCAGSGTTGVACENTNRRFIEMDTSQEYCETALTRLKNQNDVEWVEEEELCS